MFAMKRKVGEVNISTPLRSPDESSSSFSNTQPRSHSLKRAVSALPKSPRKKHCLKSVRTRSYSSQYFSTSGLNTERYFVSLRIRPNVEKYRPE